MFDHIFQTHGHLSDRDLLYTIFANQISLHQKIDNMQADVQALTTNVATLNGLVGQLITLVQNYQQQIQSGIDAQDLAAIQAANTSLTAEIGAVQAAIPAPTAPATGTDTSSTPAS